MPAARYWRLEGLRPNGVDGLVLTELSLTLGGSAVTPVQFTASHAPTSGTLSSLSDSSASVETVWSPTDVASPTFNFVWDFGAPQDIDGIRYGSGASIAGFVNSHVLQASDDGEVWFPVEESRIILWPGANTLLLLEQFQVVGYGVFIDTFNRVAGNRALFDYFSATTPSASFDTGVAVATIPDGSLRNGMYFPGTGRISSISPEIFSLTGRGEFTICFDIHPLTLKDGHIMGSFGSSSPAFSGVLVRLYASGTLQFQIYTGTSVPYTVMTPALSVGSTTAIAFEKDGTVLRAYVNGVLVSSETHAAMTAPLSGSRSSNLGGVNTTDTSNFHGYLSNLRIYHQAFYKGKPYSPPKFNGRTGRFDTTIPSTTIYARRLLSATVQRLSNYPVSAQTQIGSFNPLPQPQDVQDGGTVTLTGTVKRKDDPANVPLRRRVRLYNERDRRFIRETWSDATTGVFTFSDLKAGEVYTAFTYDHLNNYRALVLDQIAGA